MAVNLAAIFRTLKPPRPGSKDKKSASSLGFQSFPPHFPCPSLSIIPFWFSFSLLCISFSTAIMSALAADVAFDFTFPSPSPSLEDPMTPPMESMPLMEAYSLDHYPSSLLELPFNQHSRHARSTSKASSIFSTSAVSAVDSITESACSRFTTPPRASPPVRQHGPLLLPKIRSQDQDISQSRMIPASHSRSNSIRAGRTRLAQQQSTPPPPASRPIHSSHSRSFTNPETLANMAFAHISPFATPPPQPLDETPAFPSTLLGSPASFAQDSLPPSRRTSCTIDPATIDKYGYPTYRQMPFVPAAPVASQQQSDYMFPSYLPRAPSPLSLAAAAASTDATPSTTLMEYLTCPNPAASLVRTISFPLRDPSIKHFWWDVRSVSSWSSFNASAILSLPGASALLHAPVPAPLLQTPAFSSRHPETEAALHSIYASYYLPKLNSALAMSSNRPGTESTPFFGDLEITSVQLNASDADFELDPSSSDGGVPLTACLALWGLCQIAGDHTPAGHAHWRAEIGAPADGTRRKAKARDTWIPKPQLAEKREAKRSRGWVWPEDPIGRKEMGKRGVKYGGL
ncbi:hypothetical protein M440DRAFT_1466066 [Trichoderma longibrachiatum ATCC 18648]|uniref:Uncharacterized protein n=1 Tax=Trichoderma longibrachiatum ATCC 18648 TaxID=983965 RepID=A0A2T4BRK2_TRILO|nr:hypothetical protein M440DRAFT_1466066 [Trichoderma longibrachiatum ATCC 18648]